MSINASILYLLKAQLVRIPVTRADFNWLLHIVKTKHVTPNVSIDAFLRLQSSNLFAAKFHWIRRATGIIGKQKLIVSNSNAGKSDLIVSKEDRKLLRNVISMNELKYEAVSAYAEL